MNGSYWQHSRMWIFPVTGVGEGRRMTRTFKRYRETDINVKCNVYFADEHFADNESVSHFIASSGHYISPSSNRGDDIASFLRLYSSRSLYYPVCNQPNWKRFYSSTFPSDRLLSGRLHSFSMNCDELRHVSAKSVCEAWYKKRINNYIRYSFDSKNAIIGFLGKLLKVDRIHVDEQEDDARLLMIAARFPVFKNSLRFIYAFSYLTVYAYRLPKRCKWIQRSLRHIETENIT